MGEAEFESKALVEAVHGALAELATVAAEVSIGTPGGRFQVRWDEGGSATALGQLAFFAEFLEVSGLFERWVACCPMAYTSPNAPATRDVQGTWLLSILDGQRRYAHVAGLRGDAVAPQILGMKKIVSDESLRRALAHLAPKPSLRYPEAERLRREADDERAVLEGREVDGPGAGREHPGGAQYRLDPRLRCDREAALRPSGRS